MAKPPADVKDKDLSKKFIYAVALRRLGCHLILTSLDGKDSMIAEIPDASCKKIKGFPGLKKDYTAARKFIRDNIDETPGSIHYLDEGLKVKITGGGFF